MGGGANLRQVAIDLAQLLLQQRPVRLDQLVAVHVLLVLDLAPLPVAPLPLRHGDVRERRGAGDVAPRPAVGLELLPVNVNHLPLQLPQLRLELLLHTSGHLCFFAGNALGLRCHASPARARGGLTNRTPFLLLGKPGPRVVTVVLDAADAEACPSRYHCRLEGFVWREGVSASRP